MFGVLAISNTNAQQNKITNNIAQIDTKKTTGSLKKYDTTKKSTKVSDHFFIRGQIIDANSNTPLPGAHVFIKEILVGATTDYNGFYSLKLSKQLFYQ
ncbi:carboxypeptidase-like regulatory domain-containing protein [Aquimarina agarivorans]|uniref:carboxypeptidase-like regulatory domain-containing protein n=1 Tax=Aquimarina agarivorans TaxID=980584 RepID=UPI000248EBE5|nr:carboxypeptidase-like regulatory domain-containing protein [Aquimarina agarivorans]